LQQEVVNSTCEAAAVERQLSEPKGKPVRFDLVTAAKDDNRSIDTRKRQPVDFVLRHEDASQRQFQVCEAFRVKLYLGQCAQFCGSQHAMMLLRVYVDTPDQFNAWIKNQQLPASEDSAEEAGRRVDTDRVQMSSKILRQASLSN
jgi:hypothetical protein